MIVVMYVSLLVTMLLRNTYGFISL